MAAGSNENKSAWTATSACCIMKQSGSLLMAMIFFALLMPTQC